MPRPVHTPYDGSTHPFTIGLRPMDPDEWIDIDENLADYLREKDHHFATRHAEVFRAEADTLESQREVLDLLWEHLPARHPKHYTGDRSKLTIHATDTSYRRDALADRPLELASRLVQEDLVIMRPDERGHRLVAASLCFPSSWSLAEKFGLPLADVHAPVPEFGRGSRISTMIERIFTNLKPEMPVERYNWSLYDDAKLYYPESGHARAPDMWNINEPQAWIRAERQTLRRLPQSGDILFTIKICVDPVAALEQHPDGAQLACSFAEQLSSLSPAQVSYKGLEPTHEDAIAWFRNAAKP